MDLTYHKLITLILPQGKGHDVLLKLKHEKQIDSASLHNSRGAATAAALTGRQQRNLAMEKDVVDVMVSIAQADEIFEFLFDAAGIDAPGGGFMYQSHTVRGMPYLLPDDCPEEEA